MYYVYFIFAGYRVAIGRTSDIKARVVQFQRTHRKVEVLGLIPCESSREYGLLEREILKRFESNRDFRDMFFMSKDMRDWIVNNTIPIPEKKPKKGNGLYSNNTEYRNKTKQRSSKQYWESREWKKKSCEKL